MDSLEIIKNEKKKDVLNNKMGLSIVFMPFVFVVCQIKNGILNSKADNNKFII